MYHNLLEIVVCGFCLMSTALFVWFGALYLLLWLTWLLMTKQHDRHNQ